jgi:hypothetical protein
MFLADDFRARAASSGGDLVGDFPGAAAGATIKHLARRRRRLRNWIKYLKDQKADHRSSTAFERAQLSA